MEKHLHIISLDVPYPVNYGGVYDLFYKLPALQAQGVHIHLHCFDYGRGEQPELNKYCDSVQYYARNEGHKGISSHIPYIVASRKNEQLLTNLLQDDYPILMEGIHCTYPLLDNRFAARKKFVRIHNVEYQYYRHLYDCSSSLFKKMYYRRESKLLQAYEKAIVPKATAFWGVTEQDVQVFREEFNCTTIDYLAPYLPGWEVTAREGMGTYCLYHGNLAVEENEKAAAWLLSKVFNKLELPFVIAGKNPSARLQKLAHAYPHTCLVANPSEDSMHDMIAKAHIHILPSFNATGIKLKLLNALYNGRHCIVNNAMVEGTGLEEACHISNTAAAIHQLTEQLYHQPFTKQEIDFRKQLLHRHFSNEANAKQQVKWIWEQYA